MGSARHLCNVYKIQYTVVNIGELLLDIDIAEDERNGKEKTWPCHIDSEVKDDHVAQRRPRSDIGCIQGV